MLFPTVQFAIFFPIVLAISWALMSRPSLWKPFIIVASYIFYASASWRFCFLLFGSSLLSYGAGWMIASNPDANRRKQILFVAVGLHLVDAFAGLKVDGPFGPFVYRASDHQSTLGAFVGKLALKDGHGTMVDFRYVDGAGVLPSDAEVKKLRPASAD